MKPERFIMQLLSSSQQIRSLSKGRTNLIWIGMIDVITLIIYVNRSSEDQLLHLLKRRLPTTVNHSKSHFFYGFTCHYYDEREIIKDRVSFIRIKNSVEDQSMTLILKLYYTQLILTQCNKKCVKLVDPVYFKKMHTHLRKNQD